MSVWLTQAEANALLAIEKHRVDETRWRLPDLGGGIMVPLTSDDGSESFVLDISRGRANLLKGKVQNRVRSSVVLARIDFGGAPHRNPDGEEVACPHIHLYREGYGDRWAYPVPAEHFAQPDDHWQTLVDFMRYCNIIQQPIFERGLFT
ncbi:DUF6978 family protein [Microvirga massiliensis]|uniref:DUF6978 family protein n=1 Tax=Microvirga massiliensis TaxID=1033741 RepID=UPI00062BD8D2